MKQVNIQTHAINKCGVNLLLALSLSVCHVEPGNPFAENSNAKNVAVSLI
jgi:hypothetical protein